MIYSEYGNNPEYKILIKKKKFFFREAINLFLNDYETQNEIKDKAQKILDNILKVIKNVDFELDNINKIIFTKHIILELAKIDFLAKNTYFVDRILEYLKKNKIISKRSHAFVKISTEYDSNKLTRCFIETDLSFYDKVMNLRDEILNIILLTKSNTERELNLYYYLKLFSIKKYDSDIYSEFTRSKLFNLDNYIVLIYIKKYSDKHSSVKIIYFDSLLNDVLKDVFFNTSTNLFDKIDHYFENNISYYNLKSEIFLKKNYQIMTNNSSENFSIQKFIILIKRQIELEYQLKRTGFHHTLEQNMFFPKTNYLELMKIFPDKINHEKYEAVELNNIKLQKQHHILDEDDAADFSEIAIGNYLKLNIGSYIEFKEFSQFKANSNKTYLEYMKKLDKFILKYKEIFFFPEMFYQVRHIVEKSKFNKESKKGNATSTIYNHLSTLFRVCFDIIVDEGKLDAQTEERISNKIKLNSNEITKNIYKNQINPFLNLFDFNIGKYNGKHVVYARKSLIFKTELDEIYDILIEEDKVFFNITILNSDNKFIVHQRFIFCMLLYYSGLRESELWSRELQDIYILDNKIVLDIHSNDIVKSFKTISAKRRVEFTIDDTNYFDILQKYLNFIEIKKMKYLFPAISKKNTFQRKEIQSLTYFTSSNKIIQKVTGRYTSLHSFRHTFVTNNLRKILYQESKSKKDIYDFVNIVGHIGPDITLKYYAHIDYILNYKDSDLF